MMLQHQVSARFSMHLPVPLRALVKPCTGARIASLRFAIQPRSTSASGDMQAMQGQQQEPEGEGSNKKAAVNKSEFHVEIICNDKSGWLYPDRITRNQRNGVLIEGSDELISLSAFARKADPEKYKIYKTYKSMVRVPPYLLPDGTMSKEQGAGKLMAQFEESQISNIAHWSPPDISKMQELRKEGKTQKEVGELMGLNEDAVNNGWRLHGDGGSWDGRVMWSREEKDMVLLMRNEGRTQKAVADTFGVTSGAIKLLWRHHFMKENG